MKRNVVKLNENILKQIVAESVKKVLKEGIDFSEMEKWVEHQSRPFQDSSAFRQAMYYIQKVDKKLYKNLIEREYTEGVGY